MFTWYTGNKPIKLYIYILKECHLYGSDNNPIALNADIKGYFVYYLTKTCISC